MTKLKRFFIKLHLWIIAILSLLIFIFSFGTDNQIMVFIFGMGIWYALFWMFMYVTVIGTIQDIWDIFKSK